MSSKAQVYIKRESFEVAKYRCLNSETYTLRRWAVRLPDTSLVGYSSTWFGAWRIACSAVGYEVPVES